jgi:hypothetical protein
VAVAVPLLCYMTGGRKSDPAGPDLDQIGDGAMTVAIARRNAAGNAVRSIGGRHSLARPRFQDMIESRESAGIGRGG